MKFMRVVLVVFFLTVNVSANALSVTLTNSSANLTEEDFPIPQDSCVGCVAKKYTGFTAVDGTSISLTYSYDEEPAIVQLSGGVISHYTASDTSAQIEFTFQTPLNNGSPYFQSDMFVVIFVPAGTEGETGGSHSQPSSAFRGSWISTNIVDQTVYRSSGRHPRIGFSLKGPAGETAVCRFFITPEALRIIKSKLSNGDLALFLGNAQASLDVTERDGGALISVSTLLEDQISAVQKFAGNDAKPRIQNAETSLVSKNLSLGAQLPLSVAVKDSTCPNGKGQFFGWVKNGKRGQKVQFQKLVGSHWKNIAKVSLNREGGFSKTLPAKGRSDITKLRVKRNTLVVRPSLPRIS